MPQIANAADDDETCDVCGEPNRTGDSVVYVGKNWCRRNNVTYSKGLKLCIWCRHTVAMGRENWIAMTKRNKIPDITANIKKQKKRRRRRNKKAAEIEGKYTQATMRPLGKLAAKVFKLIDKIKWYIK